MARNNPTAVRFDPDVAARLGTWAAARPGLSLSSAANRLVDEALRTEEHPGVMFRTGPSGRRAGLVGGPDVWEIVRSTRSARAAEPELTEDEVVRLVSDNTGVSTAQIHTAIRYWASYPDEIDTEVAANEAAADEAEQEWARRRELLCRR